jgi:RNA polymerase sigma-70 factor (ECF subfamily)
VIADLFSLGVYNSALGTTALGTTALRMKALYPMLNTLMRLTFTMRIPLERSTPDLDQDFALIKQIAAGNDDALRELYAAYGQRLYAYAVRITGDPAKADDVIQESLVAVWKSEGRVLAWLLSIVHHKALNAVRLQSPDGLDDQVDRLADTAPSPDEHVVQSERRHQLRACLERLSLEHRTVLELVFYQGLSLSEAAQVCNCPVGTIKSRLNYAKIQLRGDLMRRGWGVEETA